MWQVYLLLKSGLPQKDETYLISETFKILSGISTENFKESVRILYGKTPEVSTPADLGTLFIDGLKKSDFFSFTHFISGFISGRS